MFNYFGHITTHESYRIHGGEKCQQMELVLRLRHTFPVN